LGYVHSNFDSERPWTRIECARLTAEAAQNADFESAPENVRGMIDSLQQEFSRESGVWAGDSVNRSAEIESIYTRATDIAGPVLRDGYHFGQTIYNDYGRPYARGFNEINGFSTRATSGPLVFYFRGEYQHAPANPDYTSEQKNLIQTFGVAQSTPVPDGVFGRADRFQVLDAYIGINFGGNQLSLGQQSLWWGPGNSGPFMFTNNAEPLKMIRLNRTTPVELPVLSKFLGPLRYDIFLGQTEGYHYIVAPGGAILGADIRREPLVEGSRFTFKPTPNFEFGMTVTDLFGGGGYPVTGSYFLRTSFSQADYLAGQAKKAGDHRSGFDITYRIPKFRDWLTWYVDQFSEDEITPLLYPRLVAMRTGIYMPKLPKSHWIDLRVEGLYTDVPNYGSTAAFYFNATYLSGFTKDGNIMGSWIGRDGRGVYATSTIWLTGANTIQLGYRETTVDRELILGGRYQDESLAGNFQLSKEWALSAELQYEHWKFPALAPLPQNNFTSSLQLSYHPHWGFKRRP